MSLLNKFFINQKNFLVLVLVLLFTSPVKTEEITSGSPDNPSAEYQSNLGAWYWQKGDFSSAIDAWRVEADIYRSQGLRDLEAEATLKMTQTYIDLGKTDLANFKLKKVLSLTEKPALLARTWNQLGSVYSSLGELEKALSAYNNSLEIEKNLSILNNLVKLYKKQAIYAQLKSLNAKKGEVSEQYLADQQLYLEEARKYAQDALYFSQSQKTAGSVTALIHWAELSGTALNDEQIQRVRKILANLPGSRVKVFLAINWAEIDSEQSSYWLSQAREIAKKTGDSLAESYALLELGVLAEQSGDLSQALDYAYLSQLKAQSKFALNSLYRAQWLAARIYQTMGDTEAAISSYRGAIASLDVLGQSTWNIDVERRLDFADEIEPIYRQTLTLLLDKNDLTPSDLKEVMFISDKLRLAQLQNYFGDNCLEINREIGSTQDILALKNGVIISSVILENKFHLFLQLPDGTLRYSKADLTRTEITEIAKEWYKVLKRGNSRRYRTQANKLYDLIIRPFEGELERINPNTIIFVHDGVLRNVPMAALYDGEKHLAEKWASASSLGLNFRVVPQSQKSKVAAFGLSVEREGWSELKGVSTEVENVIEIVKGRKFLNAEFTMDAFEKQLSQEAYSVVHLATHGQFGGVAENSFILAYDKSINALELKEVLSQSQGNIYLLVFSACETAVGSDFSALGLAGVALRSGINTVLGGYWSLQDVEQADLIEDFYANVFEKKLDKAEALRQLQIQRIEAGILPSIWAGVNLIGEW